MMLLAGDVGGTKTVVALFEEADAGPRLVRDATFSSKDHGALEQILEKFLSAGPRPTLRAACFGVAGAVINGESRTTNLPWHLSERNLALALSAPRVKLLNDLEAMAYGMLFLPPTELKVLNAGGQPAGRGHIAVIAAGTGLGEAMLYWDGSHHHPLASEGGHADYAPQTEQQVELLRYLWTKFGEHISYERILSGPGFHTLYLFLRDRGYYPETPQMAQRLSGGDPSATIAQVGLAGEDPLCVATLDLFASIYGAEAGNLALKCVAVGGVFVGGGIAPKILPALEKGAFLQGFFTKGRFRPLMERLPVCVALNPRAPLIGAAHYAARL
jgi:glucokinase